MSAPEVDGQLNTGGHKYAFVVARFNSFIVEQLVNGAIDALKRHGCNPDDITICRVPGGFEMPIAARRLLGPAVSTPLSPSEQSSARRSLRLRRE